MNKILTAEEARKSLEPILLEALECLQSIAQKEANKTGKTVQIPWGGVIIEAQPQDGDA